MPRANHPGPGEELLWAGSSLPQNVGPRRECSPTFTLAPFIGQQPEAQRGEADGPRLHSGPVAEQGITSFRSQS